MAKICAFCKSELQESDIFCGSCGHLVEGMEPPPNAWSRISADLAADPPKKRRGCLTALLIFLLIVALLLAGGYFLFLRPLLSEGESRGADEDRVRPSELPDTSGEARDEDGDAEEQGGGFSISLDDLFGPAKEREPEPAEPAETAEPTNPFDDVSEDSYYYDAVLWCVSRGVVGGTSFRPDDPCSRAQTITMLWRAVGSPEPAASSPLYTDVPESHYCFKPVQWANEAGLTAAAPGSSYRPDDSITRAQIVTFLYRLVGYKVHGSSPFTDVKDGEWFCDPAVWALDAGVIGASNAFDPNGICTRGNIATFLYRALSDQY